MKLTGLLLSFAFLLHAETAVLKDGTRISADSHENAGDMIRLYTDDGARDIPADSIEEFTTELPVLIEEPPPTLAAELPPELLTPVPKPVDARALIRAAAKKHSVPVAFIMSIMAAESSFNADAVSSKGAIGLMQVMPATAEWLGLDPRIPEQNVDAGARYLRYLMDKYRHCRDWIRRVIAAYNAGPAAVDRYRGVPPYRETRTYVARVLAYLRQFQRGPA